jgi:3'(2'),5'-bisphosphate nucleotidase
MIGDRDLQALCDIAVRAGEEIMAVYGTDFASWSKEDDSPLTEADLRSDAVVRTGLERDFPGVFILSEESGGSGSPPAAREFFLVDPLDGTKEFRNRNGEFTVNIALIEDGVAIAGVVLAPVTGELYFAARGLGSFRGGANGAGPIRLERTGFAHPLRVIGSRSHEKAALGEWLGRLAVPHTFVAAGSSLKFCRIAEDAADVYPRHGATCQWDTAAGQCVLECAGGSVVDAAGTPLRYGLDRPIVNPPFIASAGGGMQLPPLRPPSGAM